MSKSQHPDGWTLLKFAEDDKLIYKIFATWRYASDMWRLSSGASDFSGLYIEKNCFVWPQASGSVYYLPFDGENCYTMYQGMVLDNIEAKVKEVGGIFEIVKLKENVDISKLSVISDSAEQQQE